MNFGCNLLQWSNKLFTFQDDSPMYQIPISIFFLFVMRRSLVKLFDVLWNPLGSGKSSFIILGTLVTFLNWAWKIPFTYRLLEVLLYPLFAENALWYVPGVLLDILNVLLIYVF